MKRAIFLYFLLIGTAFADVKISQLPLNSAANVEPLDSFPYVNSTAVETERLLLDDLVNLPAFQTEFNTLIPSQTGFSGYILTTNGTSTYWGAAGSGTGTVTSVALTMPGEFTVTGSPITSSGTLAVTKASQNAHTFFSGPTSGGTTTPTFRTMVGADLPSPFTSGSISGNTSIFATTNGSLTNGHCVDIDSSGNLTDAGAACSSTTPGGSNTDIQFNSSGALDGSSSFTYGFGSGTTLVTIGVNTSSTGELVLANGGGSGTSVTVENNSATSAYNFNLPATAGTSGEPLLSGGGSSSPMTWGSVSGNTTTFGTTSGSLTNGHCVEFDSHGNLVDAGSACSSGSTSPGGSNSNIQFNSSGSFGGSSDFTYLPQNAASLVTIGLAGSSTGEVQLASATSGAITLKGSTAAITSYSLSLPASNGTSGQALLGDGNGNLYWGTSGVGTVTSVALSDGSSTPIYTISGSPVTSSGTLTFSLSTENANKVFSGPTSGGAAQPGFRSLVGADLPTPGASSLGGIESYASVSHQWINAISTGGAPSSTQPAFTDISGQNTVAQLRNISGSRGSPNSITAGGGISASSTAWPFQTIYVQGSGGAVTVTANPQITNCSADGQELLVVGESDSNTLTLSDGTGLSLNGPVTLYQNSNILLYCDGTNWVEVSRRP